MLQRITPVFCVALWFAAPLSAGPAADLTRLLRIDDVMEVMREEGLSYGTDLQSELFPGAGAAGWLGLVGDVYRTDVMLQRFEAVFGPEIAADPEALRASLDFFASEQGQRIVGLELAARKALLDEAVEEVARAQVAEMRREADPRVELITRFAEANDLVERNVAGALNANLAFYRGMVAGGAFDGGLSESEILSDVWSQEAEVRRETEEWLFPFLAMAYQPLSDDELGAYLTFSETAAGQTLNSALFSGFDAMFDAISQELGLAAARMMSSQDL